MSFLRNYMTFVKQNEAHEQYHIWCALVAISSLVGRKVWVRRPYQLVFPNLYVMLVGPQGNRKTAAKDVCQDILREVGGTTFSSEATTREKLIEQMSQNETTFEYKGKPHTYCPMTVCVTEFKEFVSIDSARIINFLTAIYDSNMFDYSTKKDGTQVIYFPYLNFIACETPEWLTARLKDQIISGGFSRRMVYIYQTMHHRYTFKKLAAECVEARSFCVADAKRIQGLVGEFTWEPEAEEWFDQWYMHYAMPDNPAMVGFYESKHTLLLKVAMALSASEGSNLRLSLQNLTGALELVDAAEQTMPRVFAGGGRNELENAALKIMDLLMKVRAPVLEKQVYVHLFHDCRDQREMDSVIVHLIRTGKVHRFSRAERCFLCAEPHLPEDVRALVERAGGITPATADVESPRSERPEVPNATPDLLQRLRESAQAQRPSGRAPSPSGVEAGLEMYGQSPPVKPSQNESQSAQTPLDKIDQVLNQLST